jgi:tight adherence protein B
MFAWLTVICFIFSGGLFYYHFASDVGNYVMKKFWSQAEKTYLNFELMFLDGTFTLARCKLLLVASIGISMFLVWFVSRSAPGGIAPVLILLGGLIGWFLPGIVTTVMHKKYVGNIDEQLLDAISMMGGGLSAGLSLVQALNLAASEMPAPISQEFQLMLNEYKYGVNLDDALERMAKRIPSDDLWMVIEAMLILRSTGANLVETFDIIVYTIRERKKVEGKIKTLTAMGVAQAVILISLPFVLMFVLNKLNPTYMVPLFTTRIGWGMLLLMVLMMSIGAYLIKKIVTIEV